MGEKATHNVGACGFQGEVARRGEIEICDRVPSAGGALLRLYNSSASGKNWIASSFALQASADAVVARAPRDDGADVAD
jgi:hypothetical protein